MQTEEKKKIQAWVPVSIWIQIDKMGFKSQNEAVNFAFEKIIEIQDNNQRESENNQRESENNQRESENNQRELENNQRESENNQNDSINNQLESNMIIQLQARLEDTEKQIKDFEYVSREKNAEILRLQKVIQESPDPVELADLRARSEGLQRLTEEKDKRIEDLTREIETLNVFAHYFKNVEIKQIEAPVVERKKWWKFW